MLNGDKVLWLEITVLFGVSNVLENLRLLMDSIASGSSLTSYPSFEIDCSDSPDYF